MKVITTESAQENLWQIYEYHAEYSEDYADAFYDEISEFFIENLSSHPRLGHEHNLEKGIFRLIFKKRYNIYYVIKNDTIFVIYILDGPVSFKTKLAASDAEIPTLDE